ncbi:ABC transporter substrate-binding protein [Desulfatitalea tepidiphila]|uniref:ABC transporter substrate-binding protein n=1 Tax=Desulfatitalea tepidiphila TaxID=1185843 RepID=UPI0006B451A2|nr:ABC transporter substrate-binding protein [Desulfatitalea tepidiphila]
MKMLNKLSHMAFFCIIMLVASSPCWGADTIKIGIIGPMKFEVGQAQWNGAELAAEQINAEGGMRVGNRRMKVEIIKADSNEFFSIPDAVNAMERLILKDKVDFVAGGFRTEAVLAMQDMAMDNKIIFAGAGAAHPELCLRVAKDYNRYKYWFRIAPINSSYLVKNMFHQVLSVATYMKKNLNIDRLKVAIVADKAMWADGMVKAAESYLPMMGMEVVGNWRPLPTATDVTAELTAIQRTGAHMILTMNTGPVGIPLPKQAGELKIPAVVMGINTTAAKEDFWDTTQGMCNYSMTTESYCRGVEYNELTAPFVETYYKRYGATPSYTSATYSFIKHILPAAIEKAGSLNSDKLVSIIEDSVNKTPAGMVAFEKDSEGRHLHELKAGPGWATFLAVQWVDGQMQAVWPHFKWTSPYWQYSVEPPDQPNKYSLKGLKPYVIPPWVTAAYKK